jgi:hypothetical protein
MLVGGTACPQCTALQVFVEPKVQFAAVTGSSAVQVKATPHGVDTPALCFRYQQVGTITAKTAPV